VAVPVTALLADELEVPEAADDEVVLSVEVLVCKVEDGADEEVDEGMTPVPPTTVNSGE
jgi:hypothetical protein